MSLELQRKILVGVLGFLMVGYSVLMGYLRDPKRSRVCSFKGKAGLVFWSISLAVWVVFAGLWYVAMASVSEGGIAFLGAFAILGFLVCLAPHMDWLGGSLVMFFSIAVLWGYLFPPQVCS